MGYFDKNNNNWLLLLLVVLNLALMASIWLKPEPSTPTSIVPLLQKELGLSDEQTQQFEQLRQENFDRTRSIHQQLRRNKQAMIEALGQEPSDTLSAKRLALEISRQYQEIDEALIEHYLDLKRVCTPEQQAKLNRVFMKAVASNKKKSQ